MSENEILKEASILLRKLEGFRTNAYWDNGRWSIGYATESYEGEIIDKPQAERRLQKYLETEWSMFKKYLPTLKNDGLAVPLLSKGYQYGSAIFSSLAHLQGDKNALINEAFFINEKYLDRRKQEMAYYAYMLNRYGESISPLVFLLFLGLVLSVGVWLFKEIDI